MISRHTALVDELHRDGTLPADWVAAFRAVPRHQFVPDAVWVGETPPLTPLVRQDSPDRWLDAVYTDQSLVTQVDDGTTTPGQPGQYPSSSTSTPSVMAAMLDAAGVEDGMRVLEVGAGTGWNAAILASRLGGENVTTMEVDADVAAHARVSLRQAGLDVTVVTGDGASGYPLRAPYDRVIATCAVHTIPYAWVVQTPGGRIVTPWGTAFDNGGLLVLDVDRHGTASGWFQRDDIAFMWLRGQRIPQGLLAEHLDAGEHGVGRTTSLWPGEILGDPSALFAVGLRVPGCRHALVDVAPAPGSAVTQQQVWFYAPGGASWACLSLDTAGDPAAIPVRQNGPRRLWDEVEAAYTWWVRRGRPEPTRFGVTVTVTPREQWAWLDRPDNRLSQEDHRPRPHPTGRR